MNSLLGIILAGGEGRRLAPLTNERAKPAVFFGGKYRIIDFVLSNFINSGIYKIKVLTQFKSDSLNRHIATAWTLDRSLGLFVDPVPAQMRTGNDWYKGTADAVYQNLNIIEDIQPDYVAIFGGDHIYKMNVDQMFDFHKKQGALLTIAAIPKPIEEASEFGVIEVDADGRMIGFEEKPTNPKPIPGNPGMALVSMGNYIYNRRFLVNLLTKDAKLEDSSHDFGKDIIPSIFEEYPVYVYNLHYNKIEGEDKTYWRDVGNLEEYWKANMDIKNVLPEFNLYNKSWPIRTVYSSTTPPAKFVFSGEDNDRKGEAVDSVVCGGCIISGGSVIDSVLSFNVYVHSYAEVSESILFHDVEIGRNCKLKRVIVDKHVKIPSGTVIGFDEAADTKRFTVKKYKDMYLTIVNKNHFKK